MEDSTKIGIGVAVLVGIGLYLKYGNMGAAVAESAENAGSGGGGGGAGPGSSPDAAHVIRTIPVMVADVSPVLSPRRLANLGPLTAGTAALNPALTAAAKTNAAASRLTSAPIKKPTLTAPIKKTTVIDSAKATVGRGADGSSVLLGADGYKWKSDY